MEKAESHGWRSPSMLSCQRMLRNDSARLTTSYRTSCILWVITLICGTLSVLLNLRLRHPISIKTASLIKTSRN